MVSYKKYMYSVNVYILCMHVCRHIYHQVVCIYLLIIFLPGRHVALDSTIITGTCILQGKSMVVSTE